jgi:hypothetical protein
MSIKEPARIIPTQNNEHALVEFCKSELSLCYKFSVYWNQYYRFGVCDALIIGSWYLATLPKDVICLLREEKTLYGSIDKNMRCENAI